MHVHSNAQQHHLERHLERRLCIRRRLYIRLFTLGKSQKLNDIGMFLYCAAASGGIIVSALSGPASLLLGALRSIPLELV